MSLPVQLVGAETFLFVSGSQPERFDKATGSDADAVIIDLEDAVAPSHKQTARANAEQYLRSHRCMVRVNGVGSAHLPEDAVALSGSPGLAGVVLPKAEGTKDVDVVAAFFPRTPIIALIESARGLEAARAIAAHPAVVRLAFGNLDFAADLGITPGAEEMELLLACSQLVMASRLAEKAAPVAGVTQNFRDPAVTAADARRQKALGFGGKLLIHPHQIQPTIETFRPTAAEAAWADHVISLVAAADGAAVQMDGEMIDRPVVLRAERIARKRTASV